MQSKGRISGEKGYLTLAQGLEFAEMATDLALSIKEYCSEPISVVCDEAARRVLEKHRGTIFEQVLPIHQKIHPWGGKLVAATQSPYRKTIFVDADVLFLRPVEWFAEFGDGPLSMYGAYMPSTSRFSTYYDSEKIFRDFGLERYFWATSGIFRFRRPESDPFFLECVDFYIDGIRKLPGYDVPGVADELVIGVLGARFEIGSIPCSTIHPWPMAGELSKLQWGDVQQPVVHVFGKINRSFMNSLMIEVRRRRKTAGLAGTSAKVWLHKANGRPTLLQRIHQRLKAIAKKVACVTGEPQAAATTTERKA